MFAVMNIKTHNFAVIEGTKVVGWKPEGGDFTKFTKRDECEDSCFSVACDFTAKNLAAGEPVEVVRIAV